MQIYFKKLIKLNMNAAFMARPHRALAPTSVQLGTERSRVELSGRGTLGAGASASRFGQRPAAPLASTPTPPPAQVRGEVSSEVEFRVRESIKWI